MRSPAYGPAFVVERAVGVQDVDHRQVLPAADVVVIRIVGRRDLHAAAAQLRLGPFVGHQRNLAIQQRQPNLAAGAGHVAQLLQSRQERAASFGQLIELSGDRRLIFLGRFGQLLSQLGFSLVERRGRIGMHGHGGVAEHRFGARGGDA